MPSASNLPELPVGVKRTGGPRFNACEQNLYFLASTVDSLDLTKAIHEFLLVALNEIRSDEHLATVESWALQHGTRVFLDSGVFALASEHSRKNDVPLNEVFGMAPQDVPGFDAFLERYVSIVKRLEPNLWGYIEIDLGGAVGKSATRARLEALGLAPIPVYHPFNDPPAYFDTLASQYDRICVGNLVTASSWARKRIMATLWERARAYPRLWIHLLGLTPNQWFNSYPLSSSDSSGWLACLRWTDSDRERSMLRTAGAMGRDFAYQRGTDIEGPSGHTRATQIAAYRAAMNLRNWRNHLAALGQLSSHEQS